MRCRPSRGQPRARDVVREALDLAAVVLAEGPSAQYDAHVEQLARSPHESVEVLAHLVSVLARDGALEDLRYMGLMHELRAIK